MLKFNSNYLGKKKSDNLYFRTTMVDVLNDLQLQNWNSVSEEFPVIKKTYFDSLSNCVVLSKNGRH